MHFGPFPKGLYSRKTKRPKIKCRKRFSSELASCSKKFSKTENEEMTVASLNGKLLFSNEDEGGSM